MGEFLTVVRAYIEVGPYDTLRLSPHLRGRERARLGAKDSRQIA